MQVCENIFSWKDIVCAPFTLSLPSLLHTPHSFLSLSTQCKAPIVTSGRVSLAEFVYRIQALGCGVHYLLLDSASTAITESKKAPGVLKGTVSRVVRLRFFFKQLLLFPIVTSRNDLEFFRIPGFISISN